MALRGEGPTLGEPPRLRATNIICLRRPRLPFPGFHIQSTSSALGFRELLFPMSHRRYRTQSERNFRQPFAITLGFREFFSRCPIGGTEPQVNSISGNFLHSLWAFVNSSSRCPTGGTEPKASAISGSCLHSRWAFVNEVRCTHSS